MNLRQPSYFVHTQPRTDERCQHNIRPPRSVGQPRSYEVFSNSALGPRTLSFDSNLVNHFAISLRDSSCILIGRLCETVPDHHAVPEWRAYTPSGPLHVSAHYLSQQIELLGCFFLICMLYCTSSIRRGLISGTERGFAHFCSSEAHPRPGGLRWSSEAVEIRTKAGDILSFRVIAAPFTVLVQQCTLLSCSC